MTKEELADLINGCDADLSLTNETHLAAKKSGLLILSVGYFGILHMNGTGVDCFGHPHDDLGFCSAVLYLTRKGNLKRKPKEGRLKIVVDREPQEREDPPFQMIAKHDQEGKLVELSFPPMPAPNPVIASWRITTPEQDFAAFNIYEDGELFCIGCVVDFKPVV